MEGISPFQSGRPLLSEVTADKLNRILAEIKRNRPVVSAPLSARVTGDGTHISIGRTSGGGPASAPALPQPWDLLARAATNSNPENPTYTIRVRPGTLNGILPSNWDQEFTANNTSLYYAKAVIATDGEAITGVTIAINATEPDAQEPQLFAIQESIEILFGLFQSGATYRVIAPGDIRLRSVPWLVVSPDTPRDFGELPYDIYYQLV
jgi:hypothetical protein